MSVSIFSILAKLREILALWIGLLSLTTLLSAQVNLGINQDVWKQKYGVLDAQMNEQAPYLGWRNQDADGDGVKNGDEFTAGTNPFKKLAGQKSFRAPTVAMSSTTLSLQFPTEVGKLYLAESSPNLNDTWTRGSLPSVVGDGSMKTLVVPKSAGNFFHIGVTDQATQGDQVSDWAKFTLNLSTTAPLQAQTSFTSASLAANLQSQNIVTLRTTDPAAYQPPTATAAAGDLGVINITRSGYLLLGPLTLPLVVTGTALSGVDYAPLPASITFPVGVNSLDLKITPLFNSTRTTTATVLVSLANPGSVGASGNFTLGSSNLAGVTIYPASASNGTGLTANYFNGSSSTYGSPLNFGGLAATYTYTKASTTAGTAIINYLGVPATPYVIGSLVALQFTSNTLSVAPTNTLTTYTVVAPVTATSFAVSITGTAVPSSSSGTPSVLIAAFSAPITRRDALVDTIWGFGNPNGNSFIGADNYSVSWEGYLAPTTAGNYTFQLDADDKARVFLDDGTVAGYREILQSNWTLPATTGFQESATFPLIVPASAANRYRIRVEFAETTGSAKCRIQWKIGTGSYANIPSATVFSDNISNTTGWIANYYNNSTFTPPIARTQTDSSITSANNGDWLTGTPDPAVFHNNFTARWTGQVLPQYSQVYTFVTRSDDGSRLWVNQQLIVDQWTSGSEKTGTILLQAGILYDLKMEYIEGSGSAETHLSWFSEDQAIQPIPTNRLFPTISGSSSLPGNPPAGAPAITSPTTTVALLGASSPFSQNITSSNGGTITASGLPSWLTLVNGLLSGTPTIAGTYQFTITTTNSSGSGSNVMTVNVLAAPGQLTREQWASGVSGNSLTQVPWTSVPNTTDTISLGESIIDDGGASVGERVRGYFTAPSTGNYYFWIAASNVAELWISNDSEPVNKVLRATVNATSSVPPKAWNVQTNQKSRWLSLIAGQKYFIEALHNTGGTGVDNHLSIAWFLDPSGSTLSPIANGCPPASAALGGILPTHVLTPWDNPPTISIPGTIYITNLQGVATLGGITATGGAFLRVNGLNAVLQVNYSGLSSGATSRKIYNKLGNIIFDLNTQEKNYPDAKTSDGGFSWPLQPAQLASLNSGEAYLLISTTNHPAGEIKGTFGKAAGSQTAPPAPAYPAWSSLHASNDDANSRFLTQATFGPSPSDMGYVKANGYRAWIENQFTLPPTRNIAFVLNNLSNDPQNSYGSSLMFNSWWKNSVTAPDQLRQRAAFALSQILVVSDTGPLNNNGRVLADYYDSLLEHCFGNFRTILKQVTLSPAMGVYLDMRGNAQGDIRTGLHPNENYAREILQLFSAGLYRVWPNGTLALDSTGSAVPTYDQSAITGMARVFTGWTWGQPLQSNGRLPTGFSPASNNLDPMVLVPTRHELGTKILLDNVILPAATNTNSATTATGLKPISIQSTSATLGQGNLETTAISNAYDLNGLRDLEDVLDNIQDNSAVGPFICRQLIQRLVTSHPKPEYVHRVVRAFNGEQNVDGIATGIRGDLKEVFLAILLDYEARSPVAAADLQFGKQREPLLRITAPARSFPLASLTGNTYRQIGLQSILVTTPTPHRLGSGESVRLQNFSDGAATPNSARVPTTGPYPILNATPIYTLVGATGIATFTTPGYLAGDTVGIQFTSGILGTTAPFNTVQNYTVASATPTNFTINIGSTSIATTSGNAFTPRNFTVNNTGTTSSNYTSIGSTVTVNLSGMATNDQVYLMFSTGGLAGAGFDRKYTINSVTSSTITVNLGAAPANTSGTALIPRLSGGYNVTNSNNILIQHLGNHNLAVGDEVFIKFLVTNVGIPASNGLYTVTAINGPNSFRVVSPITITNGSQGSSGMVAYPLITSQWTRNGSMEIDYNTWNVGNTDNTLNQTPLDSTTVFNYYYPDYQYPGEMARAGMTTPEFQITNDSNTMLLSNSITQGTLSNNSGNNNGLIGFLGGSPVMMDLSPYMTAAQTNNAGVPTLVNTLGTLLASGNLSATTKNTITSYVANTTNFPLATTPTSTEMRNRVRAITHLILTSAECAIQK